MTDKTFLIRNAYGEVFNEVSRPTVVFDTETGTIHKIGDFGVVYKFYDQITTAYVDAGFINQARAMALMELPKDQEIVDNVFNNTGYILKIHNHTKNTKETI